MTQKDWTAWRSLVIFGGSFDPPHRAHVMLPEQVRVSLGADGVVYVPAARAPHKLDKTQTEPRHRLAMLQLALSDVKHAAISTVELDRANDGRPSYTIDTLETFDRLTHPGTTMRLLVGTDQVAIFDKWYRWQDVEQLAEPVVMVRPPETVESVLDNVSDASRRELWRRRMVEVQRMDESSTLIRQAVLRGESVVDRVGDHVANYIDEHGLYR